MPIQFYWSSAEKKVKVLPQINLKHKLEPNSGSFFYNPYSFCEIPTSFNGCFKANEDECIECRWNLMRCFTLCSELDVALEKCNELQGVINTLFRNESCAEIDKFADMFENSLQEEESSWPIEFMISNELEIETSEPTLKNKPGRVDATIVSHEGNTQTSENVIEEKLVFLNNDIQVPLDYQEIEETTEMDEHETTDEESKSPGIKCVYELKECVVIKKKGKKVYLCNYCTFQTQHADRIKNHLISHKTDPHILCDICGKRFKFMRTFNRHLSIHDESRPFKCKICPTRSNTIYELKSHEKYAHSKLKPFICGDCSYQTVKKRAFIEHRRRHTGERPYCCPDCPYKAKDLGTLHRHQRLHSGLKKYHCTMCPFKATQKGTLTKHILTHTGEKPFPCPHCDYKATIKMNLTDHIANKHSDNYKPFSCTFCTYVTKTRSALSRHVHCHYEDNAFACQLCSYKSKHRSGLRYHMYTKHPVDGQEVPPSYMKKQTKSTKKSIFCEKKDIIVIGEEVVFSDNDSESDSVEAK